MNFRPTKLKVIASIVIPLLIWIILFFISRKPLNNVSGFLARFFEVHNFANIFSLGNIFLFLIEIIVVYLIISLFHKKFY